MSMMTSLSGTGDDTVGDLKTKLSASFYTFAWTAIEPTEDKEPVNGHWNHERSMKYNALQHLRHKAYCSR